MRNRRKLARHIAVSQAERDRRFAANFIVTGNTYPHRDGLRALGGDWDAARRVWLMPDALKKQDGQDLVDGIKTINAAVAVVEEKKRRDGWNDSWATRLSRVSEEDRKRDLPCDDKLDAAIRDALHDATGMEPKTESAPEVPGDDEIIERRDVLTSKQFMEELDAAEKDELAKIDERLDEIEAPFYAPVIAALKEELARTRGEDAQTAAETKAPTEVERQPDPTAVTTPLEWHEQEAARLEKFAIDAAAHAAAQHRLANEDPRLADLYKKKAFRSEERAERYRSQASEVREKGGATRA